MLFRSDGTYSLSTTGGGGGGGDATAANQVTQIGIETANNTFLEDIKVSSGNIDSSTAISVSKLNDIIGQLGAILNNVVKPNDPQISWQIVAAGGTAVIPNDNFVIAVFNNNTGERLNAYKCGYLSGGVNNIFCFNAKSGIEALIAENPIYITAQGHGPSSRNFVNPVALVSITVMYANLMSI